MWCQPFPTSRWAQCGAWPRADLPGCPWWRDDPRRLLGVVRRNDIVRAYEVARCAAKKPVTARSKRAP
jgi:hypothetical protein